MGEENKVTLHGMWISAYAKRVELALKVKGIPFEYVEEDLSNKSPLLIKYNPVHQKVPVLVHNGNPVIESVIIIEYIDETWKNGPRFLPEDLYKRATTRFWAAYIQQVMESIVKTFTAEDQEKAFDEFYQKLGVLEDGMKKLFPGGNRKIECGNIGLLDILILVGLGAYKAQDEVFEYKVMDPVKTPFIYAWVNSLLELPVVKQVTLPHDKVVSFLQSIKGWKH